MIYDLMACVELLGNVFRNVTRERKGIEMALKLYGPEVL